MGGSTGEIVDSAKSRARQYKRQKLDKVTREAQARVGQASGDAASGFETAMQENAEGFGDFMERNTRSLNKGSGGDGGGSDGSASANYSSKTNKSSQGSGKKADLSKDKKKKTGGKASLYAKK